MNTILILFALIGMTEIVVSSALFRPVRKLWPSMLGCAQCAGMWIGSATGASGLLQAGHGRVLDAIIVGTATSFLALLAHAVLLHLLGPVDDPSKKETAP